MHSVALAILKKSILQETKQQTNVAMRQTWKSLSTHDQVDKMQNLTFLPNFNNGFNVALLQVVITRRVTPFRDRLFRVYQFQ